MSPCLLYTSQQRIEMIWYAIHTCHSFGIEQPRISLIHCTEKVSAKFPHSLDYVNIVELAEAGEFGNVIIDGPLDVRTSCEQASGNIKGIVSVSYTHLTQKIGVVGSRFGMR